MAEYRIADTAEDYKKARRFLESERGAVERLTFPTILATQDKELVGVMGTHLNMQLKVAIAGPLIVKSDRLRMFTIIRLVENYEAVMRSCGLSSFLFRVDLDNWKWIDKIKNVLNMEPYDIRTDGMWFKWEIR